MTRGRRPNPRSTPCIRSVFMGDVRSAMAVAASSLRAQSTPTLAHHLPASSCFAPLLRASDFRQSIGDSANSRFPVAAASSHGHESVRGPVGYGMSSDSSAFRWVSGNADDGRCACHTSTAAAACRTARPGRSRWNASVCRAYEPSVMQRRTTFLSALAMPQFATGTDVMPLSLRRISSIVHRPRSSCVDSSAEHARPAVVESPAPPVRTVHPRSGHGGSVRCKP